MLTNLLRALVAGAILMPFQPTGAGAWEIARSLSYPATTQCLSENFCVFVSCPAQGKPSLEMMIYEHGRRSGEEINIEIDGKRFPLVLPERGEHDLYRWALSPDVADAIMKGRRGELHIDPQGEGWSLTLRGSGAAIGGVLKKCDGSAGSFARARGGGRLSGLSPETDCETATTRGVVVDRELNANGTEIIAFRLKDRHGVGYINVDPPTNRAAVQRQLLEMIVPNAELKAEIHGCGAAARIEVLSAVEAVK